MSPGIGKDIHAPLAGCGRIVTESLGPTQHCAGWQQGKWAKVLAGDTAAPPSTSLLCVLENQWCCRKVTQMGKPRNLLKLYYCMCKWPKCPKCLRVIVGEYDAMHIYFSCWRVCIEGFAIDRSAKIRCALCHDIHDFSCLEWVWDEYVYIYIYSYKYMYIYIYLNIYIYIYLNI